MRPIAKVTMSAVPLVLLGCAPNREGIEDGRAGLPEHTAGWAVNEAIPVARAWKEDAQLTTVMSLAVGVGADGTSEGWVCDFVSVESSFLAGVLVTDQVDCDPATTCQQTTYSEDEDWWRVPIDGWELNSDEIAGIAGVEGVGGWGIDFGAAVREKFDYGDDEPQEWAALDDEDAVAWVVEYDVDSAYYNAVSGEMLPE